MNILIVHETDYMKRVVYELQTMAELLSLAGHKVYAVDYESMWEKESKCDMGTLQTTEENVTRAYPNASVRLIRPGFIKIPVVSRITATITHFFAIEEAIKKHNIDVILLYSAPTNGIQTIHIAKRLGIPVIFRSLDILHKLVKNRTLSRMTKYIEKVVYSRVDMALTITPALSDYLKKMGMPREKIKVLPLGVDTNVVRPDINTKELRRMWGYKEEDKIIVFVGTLPMFSGLDTFIESFKSIVQLEPTAKLLIVGDGEQRKKLEKQISACGLKDEVIITGYVDHSAVPYYINMATVCINPFAITAVTRDIYPTKVMQYMACGKPVVSSPLQGMLAMNIGVDQGVLYARPQNVVRVIDELLESRHYREYLGERALEFAVKTHSYDIIIEHLEKRLNEVVK